MARKISTNVLNGFVQQAVSHNKYLEEKEMWKQRQEKNEDIFNKREKSKKKKSKHKKHRNDDSDEQSDEKEPVKEEIDDLKAILALYKDAKDFQKAAEPKWDHSGYMELYKDEPMPSTSRKIIQKDEFANMVESKQQSKKSKKRQHSDSEDESTCTDSSSNEDRSKKKKKKKKKKHRHSKHIKKSR